MSEHNPECILTALGRYCPKCNPEPLPCAGRSHQHRWIRFGKHGEREIVLVDVDATGMVSLSEDDMLRLVTDAGYAQHDPNPVETAAARRLSWARSRMQDALDRRGR